jgi:hypothetical protein
MAKVHPFMVLPQGGTLRFAKAPPEEVKLRFCQAFHVWKGPRLGKRFVRPTTPYSSPISALATKPQLKDPFEGELLGWVQRDKCVVLPQKHGERSGPAYNPQLLVYTSRVLENPPRRGPATGYPRRPRWPILHLAPGPMPHARTNHPESLIRFPSRSVCTLSSGYAARLLPYS